jgi:hypothetical protein
VVLYASPDATRDAIREDMLAAGFDEDFVEASLEEMGFRGGRHLRFDPPQAPSPWNDGPRRGSVTEGASDADGR